MHKVFFLFVGLTFSCLPHLPAKQARKSPNDPDMALNTVHQRKFRAPTARMQMPLLQGGLNYLPREHLINTPWGAAPSGSKPQHLLLEPGGPHRPICRRQGMGPGTGAKKGMGRGEENRPEPPRRFSSLEGGCCETLFLHERWLDL